jgi:hypothetical protein
MGLDIRWPIGLMFSLVGLIMTLYGLATGSNGEMYQRSMGLNINFYWGLVLLVFGGAMLVMAWRGRSGFREPAKSETPTKPGDSTQRR